MVFPTERAKSIEGRRSSTARQIRALFWLTAASFALLAAALLDGQRAAHEGLRLLRRVDEGAALAAARSEQGAQASAQAASLFGASSRRQALAAAAPQELAAVRRAQGLLWGAAALFGCLAVGSQVSLARRTRRALHGPLLSATLLAAALVGWQQRSLSQAAGRAAEQQGLLALPEGALVAAWEAERSREPAAPAPARLVPASALLGGFVLLWLGFWVRLREYERGLTHRATEGGGGVVGGRSMRQRASVNSSVEAVPPRSRVRDRREA